MRRGCKTGVEKVEKMGNLGGDYLSGMITQVIHREHFDDANEKAGLRPIFLLPSLVVGTKNSRQ
jgi:hypothetical protein